MTKNRLTKSKHKNKRKWSINTRIAKMYVIKGFDKYKY